MAAILDSYSTKLYEATVTLNTNEAVPYRIISARYPGKIEVIRRGCFRIQVPLYCETAILQTAAGKAYWWHCDMWIEAHEVKSNV